MKILGDDRPDIEYPIDWKYKVIGQNLESMLKTIDDLLIGKFKYDLTPSNISNKGKYYSLNLVVTVNSEVERDMVYHDLLKDSDIKMVL